MSIRSAVACGVVAGFLKLGVLGALLAMASPAHAAIYKCKLGATVSYQEQPCEKHAVAERLDQGTSSNLAGCFAMQGLPANNPLFVRVDALAPGKFEMQLGDGKSRIKLADATPADVRMVNDQLHINAVRGLKWVISGSDEKRPIGIYTIKDKDGDESVFGVFLLANGIMKREACH